MFNVCGRPKSGVARSSLSANSRVRKGVRHSNLNTSPPFRRSRDVPSLHRRASTKSTKILPQIRDVGTANFKASLWGFRKRLQKELYMLAGLCTSHPRETKSEGLS